MSCRAGAPTCPAPTSNADASPVDGVANELVKRINAKDWKGVFALYGVDMAKAVPEAKTGPFVSGIVDSSGHIVSVERIAGDDSPRAGTFNLKAERGELRMELHIDKDARVTGLSITNAPNPEPPVVRSTVPLVLPFHGQWLAFWAGDKPDVNHHVGHESQRRAADLVVVDAEGKAHHGEGKKNEDYLAYGEDALAVADGTVITVTDGVPENTPGEQNPAVLAGNAVTVKHSESLYSLYAHLQPGKMQVKVGANVKQGGVLGACGNSGNSSEPHLHFQLQDAPLFEKSWGIEAVFRDVPVVRDGKPSKLAEYTWLKGDLVGEPTKK